MNSPPDAASRPIDAVQVMLDKTHLGAAASKLFAASIGDVVVVMSRSLAHKYYSLADIEWMVLPAVTAGQYYVAEAADKETGFRAPIAVATWAFVSEEVDRRLQGDLSSRMRLRPDEWKSGEIAWIVDLVGEPRGITAAMEWMKAGPLKEKTAKIVVRNESGSMHVAMEVFERSNGTKEIVA